MGAEWVGRLAQKHGIGLRQRGIEVGVRVEVHNDSVVEECVVMGGVQIGKGVRLRRCVIEESACIPDGSVVGHDDDKDRIKFKISPEGVRVIPTRAPLP